MLRESELGAALDEEYSRRYIAMTCKTDDPEIEKAYLHFIENVVPHTKPRWDTLNKAYLASPWRAQMNRSRWPSISGSSQPSGRGRGSSFTADSVTSTARNLVCSPSIVS